MGRETPRWLVLAVALGLTLAACGGGASADVTAFCESVVETEGLVSNGPGDDVAAWAGQVTEAFSSLDEEAPDEVRGAIETISGAILPAVESGDEEALFGALESEEVGEASAVLDTYMTGECGWDVSEVRAVDYGFEGDLDGLRAGFNGISFENAGTELHEMIMFRFNDDTTETVEELFEMPEEEAMGKVTMSGAAFGAPGDSDTVFLDLEAGRYAIVCFLPVGSTPENMEAIESGELEGPPHFTQGMVREFTVEG